MAKGEALLAGLKGVDPTCYNGWDGTAGPERGRTGRQG